MATQIPEFIPSRRKYPWKKWSNGKTWRAVAGVDFYCAVNGFRSALRSFASRNGLVVTASAKKKIRHGKVVTAVDFHFSKKPRRQKQST